MSAPVGRLAPTPSGFLHLGNARSFLLAWLWARSEGGRVVLRIEDVDRARCRAELRDQALRDLEWLGLDWDEGPRAGDPPGALDQSTRRDVYRAALDELARAGLAYPCMCTRRDLEDAARAPHGESDVVYPGTCRGRFRDADAARSASGRAPAWRFRWDGATVSFRDEISGAHEVRPANLGDFVVWGREGWPSYQLAAVVDDAAGGITQVLRGRDLLFSTARQLALYAALGLRAPERWAHVPLLQHGGGERLAKRRGDLALASLRAEGVDPRRIVGYLARSAGIATIEAATPQELVRGFALDLVSREDTFVDLVEARGVPTGPRD